MFTIKVIDTSTQHVQYQEFESFNIVGQSTSPVMFRQLTEDFVCEKTRSNTAVVITGKNGEVTTKFYLHKGYVAYIMNSNGKTVEVIKANQYIPNL